MEIFTFNNTMLQEDMTPVLKEDEYKLFLEVERIIKNNWEECNKNNEILFITDELQDKWIKCLTGYSNDILENELKNNEKELIENIESNIYKYIVITKNTKKYEKYGKYINVNELNLIYEDNTGIIYQKY